MVKITENPQAEGEIPTSLATKIVILVYNFSDISLTDINSGEPVSREIWQFCASVYPEPKTYARLKYFLDKKLIVTIEQTKKLVEDVIKKYGIAPDHHVYLYTYYDSLNREPLTNRECDNYWMCGIEVLPLNEKAINQRLQAMNSPLRYATRKLIKTYFEI